MQLTVLIDNNTLTDRYFLGEPGVSYLIEDKDKQILFDVGYSDAFAVNARKLKINLLDSDFVVLSHGHLDHTWGLTPLIKLYTEAEIEGLPYRKTTLVAHPQVFNTKAVDGLNEIGSIISSDKLSRHFKLNLTKKPFWLTEQLFFLGEIERSNKFENTEPAGKVYVDEDFKDDFVLDDSALAYKSSHGLVVITGCSHSGICNIIDYAKKVCNEDRVIDVIGGFHLLDPSPEQLNGTLEYFRNLKPKELHACHCVDLKSKIALSKVANLMEVGVGLSLNYD
jgi:7,8-dihydropterin-6-yl-methyl-4-(beta-D-ribofuranosyl)aminobenzene 5'-phosphate synthase